MTDAQKPAVYADLEHVPPNKVGEIVGGVLYTSPRPGAPHAVAATALGEELGPPFKRGRGGPGGWMILFEPELHLGGDALVPDLAGWRRERLPVVPDVAAFELAPDWVCETLSASTAALDRAKKVPAYAREGVTHVWLLDPAIRTLEVYRLEGGTYRVLTVFEGNTTVRAEPFEAIELDLSILWAR